MEVLENLYRIRENAGMLRALDLTEEEKSNHRYLSFNVKLTMYIANVKKMV